MDLDYHSLGDGEQQTILFLHTVQNCIPCQLKRINTPLFYINH